MMTKLKFLWVLLALLVGGIGDVWADATYEYKYSPALNTSGYFTVNNTDNFSSFPSNTVQVDAAYITGATKMGNTTVTFTTSAASSTVYVGIYIKTENQNTFTFDNADKSLGTSGSATAGTYGLVTIENVAAGLHTISKKSGNEVELYYVKVVEHNYSYPDATVQSYPHTWDFTTSSSDWGTTSTQVVSYDDWRAGSNDNPCTYYVTGTAEESRGFNIDVLKGLRCQSYYLGVDWGYGHIYVTAGSITIPSVPAGYGIIFTMEGRQGLPNNAVATTMTTSQATPASATINPTEGSHTTYTFDVASAGDVTFNFNGAISIKSIAVTPNTFTGVYTPYTTTDLQIGTPNNNIYILDGDDKERTLKGTYTFTGPGRIAGGTVIDEVPGITLTVGASGDSWDVVEGNGDVNPDFKKTETNQTWNIGYVAVCKTAPNTRPGATSGCFYTFEAIVNGELTIHYYTRSGAYVYNGSNQVTSNSNSRIQNITFKVEAGKTYTLEASTGTAQSPSEGIIWLNSFTFTPMFFHPGTTTNQHDYTPAVFPANMNTDKSAFPKLINPSSTDQQNKVKFAGDKAKVYLYKNNDVELLAAGEDILIRGTVLDKNNEDGLVAYYYLNSYVLTVSSYELEDQAYIATDGLTDNNYRIVFSGNVQPANSENIDTNGNGTVTVQVQKDNGTPWNVTAHTYSGQANLFIPIDPLEAGATYRITIPANSIALTANADTKNSKIERTFSVNAVGEAQVKMIYPTGLATVGTTIVLETYLDGTASNVNNSHKVKGILTGGGTTMPIDATFGTNQLAFKPTSTLKPNTTYTLTIPNTYDNKDNNIYLSTWYRENEQYYKVTHSKVFTFTTGSSSGTAPYVIANGTTPAEGATVPGSQYSGGTISFEFDQAVELEPYSTVKATPINGRESTASGVTGGPEAANNTLVVGADGKTVSFNYSADGLKYDMYYEVVIPANTVVGAGGLPNSSDITLHFRMGMNPSATPVTVSSFYPHTWDFNKFGDKTVSGTTAYNLVNNCGDPGTADKRINSLYQSTEDGYTKYTTKNQEGYEYDQGADVYFNNKNGVTEVMDEFEGIRISMVAPKTPRFEIRNITSKETTNKNADGTDKWQFRMNGNTHYMTLSNVPVGKLYMVVGSNALIGINSPNAHFVEDVKFSATTHESITKITNTNGTKKLVLDVTEAGDVTFCLANFTCEKIAFATDDKTFKSGFAESGKTYATDRLTYDVRYDLLNAFTDHNVKAYYVTGIVDNAEDNTATINAREVTYGVAGADEGVILLYQAGVAVDTNVPVFKADVNSAEQSGQTNELKVIESNTTTVPTPADDCYMYVLSNKGSKSDGVAFYRYTGNTFSDRAAYLEVPKYMVNPSISGGSARVFRMVFYNEDGSETTVIRTVGKDGVTEKAEQAGGYYDLRGQRLAKPNKRGLYIKDGKKVYVK